MTAPRPDLAVVELREWLRHRPSHTGNWSRNDEWAGALDQLFARCERLMMDRNTLRILRNRIRGRVFDGQPDVVRNGDAYHEALMNTGGVGLACFPDASDQSAAFNAAWKQEAYAARAYIYALEKALVGGHLDRGANYL